MRPSPRFAAVLLFLFATAPALAEPFDVTTVPESTATLPPIQINDEPDAANPLDPADASCRAPAPCRGTGGSAA